MHHRSQTRRRRAFSLVEVMVALALSGLVVGTAVIAFHDSVVNQATAKHEWVAFSIAQQRMELLASSPKTLRASARRFLVRMITYANTGTIIQTG